MLFRSFANSVVNVGVKKPKEYSAETIQKIKQKLDAAEDARYRIRNDIETDIQGFDIDGDVIKSARENAKLAGVDHLIHFQQRPVAELSHPKKYGFLITNPPYGERLEDKKDLPALYQTLGERYRALDSWSMYLITSYEDAERYLGKKADKNRKIYNEAAIKSAENLTESDYTAASWSDLCVELKEAKDELAAPHTQSTVDEATEHLNAAIKALVKAETKEETKTDVTKLNAVIEKAEALKQSDYTAESWKNLQTALDAAKKLTDVTAEQTVVDQAASDLETAILALVKADTENTGTTDKKKKPAVGTVKTVGQIKYKVTGKNTVTVNKYAKKNITKEIGRASCRERV